MWTIFDGACWYALGYASMALLPSDSIRTMPPIISYLSGFFHFRCACSMILGYTAGAVLYCKRIGLRSLRNTSCLFHTKLIDEAICLIWTSNFIHISIFVGTGMHMFDIPCWQGLKSLHASLCYSEASCSLLSLL